MSKTSSHTSLLSSSSLSVLPWIMENIAYQKHRARWRRGTEQFCIQPGILGKYQSWSSANNLPDAAPNWIRGVSEPRMLRRTVQKRGKWLLYTWQNLCWVGGNESYSALTAETSTQLHCALQSVVLRHEEWHCKDVIHATRFRNFHSQHLHATMPELVTREQSQAWPEAAESLTINGRVNLQSGYTVHRQLRIH